MSTTGGFSVREGGKAERGVRWWSFPEPQTAAPSLSPLRDQSESSRIDNNKVFYDLTHSYLVGRRLLK